MIKELIETLGHTGTTGLCKFLESSIIKSYSKIDKHITKGFYACAVNKYPKGQLTVTSLIIKRPNNYKEYLLT